jgi:hypothetical protein
MNEEIKKQMLLNSESYQFFLNETRKAEKKFFRYSALCGLEMEKVSNDVEQQISNGGEGLNLRGINLNIFSEAINQGKRFITTSNKFLTELKMMKKLSVNIMDDDLGFGNDKDDFMEEYIGSIDKTVEMQYSVSNLILNEIEVLQSVIDNQLPENDSDEDDGGEL